MGSRFSNLLFILSVIASESTSVGDTLFQDQELSLDSSDLSFYQPASLSDESVSFFDPTSPSDGNESLFDSASLTDGNGVLFGSVAPADEIGSLIGAATLHEDSTLFSGDTFDPYYLVDSPEVSTLDSTWETLDRGTDRTDSDLFDLVESSEDSAGNPTWHSSNWDMDSAVEFTSNSLPDDEFYDDSFEVSGCSTSEYLSRIRRRDDSNICPIPLGRPSSPSTSKKARNDYKSLTEQSPDLNAFILNRKPGENNFCLVLSRGILALGFCPSPNPEDSWFEMADRRLGFLKIWTLRNPIASTLIQIIHVRSIFEFLN
jgi:hypothetical protein